MYCIKCGVELADSEKVCPLCGTRVFHPDLPRSESEAPFPADNRVLPEDVNRSGVLFILTALTLLPAVLCIVCDWRINGSIVWSGYAAGGVALLDGRIKLLGTRALLVTHRALGLQPCEHGDDGVLLPAGFLSQGGGELCDGLRRGFPETVHQLPLRIGQIAGHRTFLLSVYGCIPI